MAGEGVVLEGNVSCVCPEPVLATLSQAVLQIKSPIRCKTFGNKMKHLSNFLYLSEAAAHDHIDTVAYRDQKNRKQKTGFKSHVSAF